jgi:hypothetical protein
MHRVFVESEGASGLYVRCIYSGFRHILQYSSRIFVDIYSYVLLVMSNISDSHLCSVLIVNNF